MLVLSSPITAELGKAQDSDLPMTLGIHKLMTGLARTRPVFYSEADFQFALAWHIQEQMPNCSVRLEYRPCEDQATYLDIWIPTLGTAIELKYKTRQLSVSLPPDAELFSLRDHSAMDLARYDFLADVQRLERVVRERGPVRQGFAVFLTNDRRYWSIPEGETAADDAAFRLHESRQLSGTLMWAHRQRLTAKRDRQQPVVLSGSYEMCWHTYSDVTADIVDLANIYRRRSRFRYLVAAV